VSIECLISGTKQCLYHMPSLENIMAFLIHIY